MTSCHNPSLPFSRKRCPSLLTDSINNSDMLYFSSLVLASYQGRSSSALLRNLMLPGCVLVYPPRPKNTSSSVGSITRPSSIIRRGFFLRPFSFFSFCGFDLVAPPDLVLVVGDAILGSDKVCGT